MVPLDYEPRPSNGTVKYQNPASFGARFLGSADGGCRDHHLWRAERPASRRLLCHHNGPTDRPATGLGETSETNLELTREGHLNILPALCGGVLELF